ncbi:MAG: response regulator transcription factor, partial [Acidobacteriota bacterium]
MDLIKVLLVDDHALFRAGVAGLLRQQKDFNVVGEAQDGREAVEKAADLMPDIILMDVYMPRMSGLEATRRLKKQLPYVKIVMLTVSEDEKDLFEAVKAGAQGYLLKKIQPQEFLWTLRGAYRGEAPIFRRLSESFELCVFGLNLVRQDLERFQRDTYRRLAATLNA